MNESTSKWLLLGDPATASAVIGALKRSFSRSPIVRAFLHKHRIEKPYIKKNGSISTVPRVFYKCFKCLDEFPAKQINVDHIDPVIPVNIPVRHMCLDTIVQRLYCSEEKLQLLCKRDHNEKSAEENRQRNEWLTKTKYIVYKTYNRINNKRYIGVHKCDDYDEFYLGSGLALKAAIQKYGRENFFRVILNVFDNADDAFKLEAELVDDKVVLSENYYNTSKGGRRPALIKPYTVKAICHETGEIFDSVNDVALAMDVTPGHAYHYIDNPDLTINNLHFFRLDDYNKNIKVTYPNILKPIVCLNNRVQYKSIAEAANNLSLNYKSLRNAMCNDDEIHSLFEYKFVYLDDYDVNKTYSFTKSAIRCVESGAVFDSARDAAVFLGRKDLANTAIGINKAIRLKRKMYKYTWERIPVVVKL